MIIDISDDRFKNIIGDEDFKLPIRWDGSDFLATLKNLYKKFYKKLQDYGIAENMIFRIQNIYDNILKAIETYLDGLPSDSFISFDAAMNQLFQNPLKIYQKSWIEPFDDYYDPLKLFRIVSVQENTVYKRNRVFHPPYNLRAKISTSRYSIAGYPSLYLGTTLKLCNEELRNNPFETYSLASRFQLVRNYEQNKIDIKVIELAIKPQDFIEHERSRNESMPKRKVNISLLRNSGVKSAYLHWYPLIAACSFIRANKKDAFAVEYIIPQLLMQWIRKQSKSNSLIGLRYFSCASQLASDYGFNYVFPASGKAVKKSLNYCKILAKSFELTNPVFIHDYQSFEDCEDALKSDNKLEQIK